MSTNDQEDLKNMHHFVAVLLATWLYPLIHLIYNDAPTLVDADHLPGPPVLDEVPRSCGDVPGLEDAEVAEAGLLV